MNTLHLFYDAGCGMCGKLRQRFESEPTAVKIHFVAYQSPEAKALVPDIERHHPEKGMLVLTEDGRLLNGVESWLRLLAATIRYQKLGHVLGKRWILPFTRWTYERVAQNRRLISRILGLKNLTDEELKCSRCAW